MDRSTQMLLDGLSRAAADPAGLPLYAVKGTPGLFAANTAGKQLARRCKEEGFLRVIRTDTRGKTPVEICAVTEKGLAYLLGQVNPRQVLEDFIRALDAKQSQAADLVSIARQMQTSLEALRSTAEKVLQQLAPPSPPAANGSETWPAAALAYLEQWQTSGAAGDCPLPQLYRHCRVTSSGLTVGHFHDGLRQLHDEGLIYLHPWTGPLYDMPEPQCALLVGHEIAYYASKRIV